MLPLFVFSHQSTSRNQRSRFGKQHWDSATSFPIRPATSGYHSLWTDKTWSPCVMTVLPRRGDSNSWTRFPYVESCDCNVSTASRQSTCLEASNGHIVQNACSRQLLLRFKRKVGWRRHASGTKVRFSSSTMIYQGMGHIHLRGKWRPRTPRWYNAALTHTKWMGNPSSPTLSSNCENRRAFFCQTSPGMHVWGVLVPIRTVFMRSNRSRSQEGDKNLRQYSWLPCCQGERR